MLLRRLFRLVPEMDQEAARRMMAEEPPDSFTLLDVRQPSEYEQAHLPGARLIPLPELTDRLGEIPKDRPVLVYCAVGGRSATAAQLLSGQGFGKVHSLKGGIRAWLGAKPAGPKASGPVMLGMEFLRGDESPKEAAVLAAAMEKSLGDFYRIMAHRADRPEAATTLRELALVEDAHLGRLYQLHRSLDPSTPDQATFEAALMVPIMEGGYRVAEFLAASRSRLGDAAGVIEAAMTIENQALDLYLRYAQRLEATPTGQVFQDLAREEKFHLKRLGESREALDRTA